MEINEKRILAKAGYMKSEKCSYERIAGVFGISAEVVEEDLIKNLKELDEGLYVEISRHLRIMASEKFREEYENADANGKISKIIEYQLKTGASCRKIAAILKLPVKEVKDFFEMLPKINTDGFLKIESTPKSLTETVIEIANYKLETYAANKEIAEVFRISPQLVSKYLCKKLPEIDNDLYRKIKSIPRISDDVSEKILELANYKLKIGASVEEIAKKFNLSPSWVYSCLGALLLRVDKDLYLKIKVVKESVSKELTEKVLKMAEYLLETGESVASVSKKFGVSKTMAYNYFNDYLPKIDNELYLKVQAVLKHRISDETVIEIAKYRVNTMLLTLNLVKNLDFQKIRLLIFFTVG